MSAVRIQAALVLALLGTLAVPAWAEFPFALSGVAGGGLGLDWHDHQTSGPLAGILAVEVAWRDRPGRAITLTYQAGGGGSFGAEPFYGEPRLRDTTSGAVLVGVEGSRPGHGVRGYVGGNVGVGWITADLGLEESRSVGLAFSGTAGLRLIPSEGGVGLLLGLRTSHVVAQGTGAHALLLLLLGLTVRPR